MGPGSTESKGRNRHLFNDIHALGFTATDASGTAIAQQMGRRLTGGPFVVNLVTPGTLYGGGALYGDRNRQIDVSLKKIIRRPQAPETVDFTGKV